MTSLELQGGEVHRYITKSRRCFLPLTPLSVVTAPPECARTSIILVRRGRPYLPAGSDSNLH